MAETPIGVLVDQTSLCEAARLLQGVPTGEEYLSYTGSRYEHWA
jgi:hypothetical protein